MKAEHKSLKQVRNNALTLLWQVNWMIYRESGLKRWLLVATCKLREKLLPIPQLRNMPGRRLN